MMKYFIEDTDTHLWYRNTISLGPTVHTYGQGWDKPELQDEDYWTNDPHQAFDFFKSKEEAELWLTKLLDKKYYWFQNDDRSMKNLIITEHEFVNHKCTCIKGVECCNECS